MTLCYFIAETVIVWFYIWHLEINSVASADAHCVQFSLVKWSTSEAAVTNNGDTSPTRQFTSTALSLSKMRMEFVSCIVPYTKFVFEIRILIPIWLLTFWQRATAWRMSTYPQVERQSLSEYSYGFCPKMQTFSFQEMHLYEQKHLWIIAKDSNCMHKDNCELLNDMQPTGVVYI